MKKLLILSLFLLSNVLYSETWSCYNQNASILVEVKWVKYTREEGGFISSSFGDPDFLLKIIEENDNEIILHSHLDKETWIDILDKKNNTFVVYGSDGMNPLPLRDKPPSWGECNVSTKHPLPLSEFENQNHSDDREAFMYILTRCAALLTDITVHAENKEDILEVTSDRIQNLTVNAVLIYKQINPQLKLSAEELAQSVLKIVDSKRNLYSDIFREWSPSSDSEFNELPELVIEDLKVCAQYITE